MARYVVASVDELEPGAAKRVAVAGRDIALFNVHGEFFALANRCPHEGASLCLGRMVPLIESDEPGQYRVTREGELLRCPWHGWEFDVRTGRSWCDPQRMRVKSYDVAVVPGSRLVEGPYKAEVFPVSIEQNYVIVEV